MSNVFILFIDTLLLVLLILTVDVHAYDEYGHYYTLLALYDTLPKTVAHDKPSQYEYELESFCAELPDLAQELDAITLRVKVFLSINDFQWGLRGHCSSIDSRLMVASHYYLHGLSGTPANKLRDAANDIIKSIDKELKNPKLQINDRKILHCARGFAAHLYADSFAHVQLSTERPDILSRLFARKSGLVMYKTGIGHYHDDKKPDYLYGHYTSINRWPKWVLDAGNIIAKGADIKRVLHSRNSCGDGDENCAQKALLSLVQMNSKNKFEMFKLTKTGTDLGYERTTSCDEQLKNTFPDIDCSKVWKIYLNKAIVAFKTNNIDPSSYDIDESCSAWHYDGNICKEANVITSCTDISTFGKQKP